MNNLPKLYLKQGREKSLLKKHLWIFSGAVYGVSQDLQDGDVVEVLSSSKEYLATGHFQNGSICVRIFSFNQADTIDEMFWEHLIVKALDRRKALSLTPDEHNNAFRIIHGESDMMPGLIADYYNGVIVLQAHSVGMFNLLPTLSNIFVKIMGNKVKAVYSKSKNTIKQAEDETVRNQFLYGSADNLIISENDMKFNIDFVNGQKTGFFLDQRDNRRLLSQYCKGKSVLNIFGYTGAFSVAALFGGASKVVTVDISADAIKMTDDNVALNFPCCSNHYTVVADAFEYLTNTTEKFDIIVLDPPAFAKHLDAKDNAMKAYRRLNALGLKKLNANGLLFTFSCSQVIRKTDFLTAVYNAASDTNKNIAIVHQLHQATDHYINIFHPETEYLKGFVLISD